MVEKIFLTIFNTVFFEILETTELDRKRNQPSNFNIFLGFVISNLE